MADYSIEDLQVLSPQDHIRLRSGMYIGESLTPVALFNEIFDNALDETQGGYSDHVDVIINYDDNTYEIKDYGRGFPQGTLNDPTSGRDLEALELLCTTSFSGGKFNTQTYKLKTGLHGLGMLVTNSLSDSFSVTTWRSNSVVSYEASKGYTVSINKVINKDNNYNKSGTVVKFTPDSEMFQSSVIPFSHIVNRCKIASAFNMKVNLTRIENNKSEEIDVNSDIYDLLPQEDDNISEYYRHSFTVHDNKTGEFATIALKYTSDTKCYYRGYTNLLYNSNGGTHHKMFSDAISEVWDYFGLTGVKSNDIFLGLRAVVAVFISDTEFSSQSKERLSVPKSSLDNLKSLIVKELIQWLSSNDDIRNSLIKRFQEYRLSQNKLLARKEIKSLLKVNTSKNGIIRRSSQVYKLKECDSRTRDNTELFIVEGDSALGSAVQARNPQIQAIIPVRGKVFNVARCSNPKDAIQNEETRSIINVIGAGLGEECDPDKSRYEKIIIMCDSDADGKEIATLLSSLFINLLPNLVKSGMVYVALPPLYGWTDKKGFHFTNKQSEIPVKEYVRFKGLGEMDPDELRISTMDPSTRRLVRVQYPEDLDRFNSILTSSGVKYSMLQDQGVIREEL